jgi:hypothetical protein
VNTDSSQDQVRVLVDAAPPLTPAQRAKLAAIIAEQSDPPKPPNDFSPDEAA